MRFARLDQGPRHWHDLNSSPPMLRSGLAAWWRVRHRTHYSLIAQVPRIAIVLITAYASIDTAVEAMRTRCVRLPAQAVYTRTGQGRF